MPGDPDHRTDPFWVVESVANGEIRAERVAEDDPGFDTHSVSDGFEIGDGLGEVMRATTGAADSPWFGKPRARTAGRQRIALQVVHAAGSTGQHDNVRSFTGEPDVEIDRTFSPHRQCLHCVAPPSRR
ncbi:hypothetical protein MTY414_67310 [Mycolicibacterium mageritense]|nr:hypothetical protein MTY414_67310 [Mycolicibacterium mageritense]